MRQSRRLALFLALALLTACNGNGVEDAGGGPATTRAPSGGEAVTEMTIDGEVVRFTQQGCTITVFGNVLGLIQISGVDNDRQIELWMNITVPEISLARMSREEYFRIRPVGGDWEDDLYRLAESGNSPSQIPSFASGRAEGELNLTNMETGDTVSATFDFRCP